MSKEFIVFATHTLQGTLNDDGTVTVNIMDTSDHCGFGAQVTTRPIMFLNNKKSEFIIKLQIEDLEGKKIKTREKNEQK